jgi:hypothetical protein
MDALQDVQTAAEFGPSFLTNLQQRFAELSSTEFIAIRLGPAVWWNTRLHLASALASDFTEIKQFMSVFGQAETRVKQDVLPASLRELGIKPDGAVLEQDAREHKPFSYSDIMQRRQRYVVLMRDGNLEGVIDRVELASRIAASGM